MRNILIVFGSFFLLNTTTWALDEKPKTPIVFVKKVQSTELYDVLLYPARVSPKINTTVLAESEGVITKIYAPLGQKVSKNQKIMTLQHQDPVYQYAPLTVRSPVSGIVSQVHVTEGTQINKGDKLAAVTDPNRIRVNVEVPAQDLSLLKEGLQGQFKVSSSDQQITVRVRGLSPFVDPATGTASAELEILEDADKAAKLAPGLIGQVTFKTNLRKGFSISDDAIVYRGGSPFVRVVEEGKAKRIPVELGVRQRGYVEILKGLKDGSDLIERTSRFVNDDEAVTVQSTEGT